MIKKKYLFILLVCLFGLGAIEYMRPREVDWSVGLLKEQTKPFGCYAFFQSLPDLFGGKTRINRKNVFDFLKEEHESGALWMLVDKQASVDSLEWERLKSWAGKGNEILISSFDFPEFLLKDLRIGHEPNVIHFSLKELSYEWESPFIEYTKVQKLKNNGTVSYFVLSDSTEAVPVSAVELANEKHPVSLVFPYKKGRIILDANPLSFTNVNLLHYDGIAYAEGLLANSSADYVIWDEYFTVQKDRGRSFFSVVWSYGSLRKAYLVLLLGVLLYLFFEGKRKQRAIPIVTPPENTTGQFIKSISYLHFIKKDHRSLLKKKWMLFNEFLYENYYRNLFSASEEEVKHLERKMSLEEGALQRLKNQYQHMLDGPEIRDAQLKNFVIAINKLKKK
ncbi:MAG: DUF4350 domain-containing protein [Cytophagales bacterium]|nr:DUF4350 domain-containing protein [Cytophagales bacterium]